MKCFILSILRETKVDSWLSTLIWKKPLIEWNGISFYLFFRNWVFMTN